MKAARKSNLPFIFRSDCSLIKGQLSLTNTCFFLCWKLIQVRMFLIILIRREDFEIFNAYY